MRVLAGVLAAGLCLLAFAASPATAEPVKPTAIADVGVAGTLTDVSSRRYRRSRAYAGLGYSHYRRAYRYPWNVYTPCGASVVFPRDPRCGIPGVGPWAYYYGLWGQ